MRVEFTVPGKPASWARVRSGQGRHFNTDAHDAALKAIGVLASRAMRLAQLQPFTGPVRLSITAVHPRSKRRPAWATPERWKGGERLYKPTTPDVDNLAKMIGDALQPKKERGKPRPAPFCLADDKQVCELHAVKVVAAKGEAPHTLVVVEALQP